MKTTSSICISLLLISMIFFSACSKKENQETTPETTTTETTPELPPSPEPAPEPQLAPKPEEEANYLARYQSTHAFSDPNTEDTFTLTATGDEGLQASDIVFSIVNAAGDEIYREEFQGYDLVNYGYDEEKGTRDEFVKTRMENFFIDENFMTPAIKADEEYSEDFSDEAIWNDVKGNPDAIGFHYLLGVEDGRSIAWSPSLKKTVMYFNCC